MMKPLAPALSALHTHDIVSVSDVHDHSTDHKRTRSLKCLMPNELFVSSWYAGRKGNKFSETWWNNIKAILGRDCPAADFSNDVERVCCHSDQVPRVAKKTKQKDCHVPWGHLENLRIPAWFARKHPKDAADITQLPSSVKLTCLNGRNSFNPQLYGELFWIPWDKATQKTPDLPRDQWEIPDYYARCKQVGSADLACEQVVKPSGEKIEPVTYREYLNRPAYRLFLMNGMAKVAKNDKQQPWTITTDDILNGDWLVSELYRRALK